MSKPVFRLQTVLDFRATALEQAENALRDALRKLELARARRDEAQAEADRFAERVCADTSSRRAGERERFHLAYRAQIDVVNARQKEIDRCFEEVKICRERVLKASREHEILVRLKQKWLKKISYEAERKQESLLNDIINARFFRTAGQAQLFEFQQA